ncbi:M23 family metallopeptidase [Streptomyces sodiiphilus]|uniref:M23 family metallopeptidase n=1 Tax=Streptomyces sodiiphilus TaxID=226217 RepID=A0ABN2PP52_9ACTN
MASNRHAYGEGTTDTLAPYDPHHQEGNGPAYFGPERTDGEPISEWNPSADTIRPVRGRHRVAKQRGGSIARSRAVLGVGVFAAVGAGGMTTAEGNAGVPGMDAAADKVRSIPDQIPGLGTLVSADEDVQDTVAFTSAPLTQAAAVTATADTGSGADAGEALRARILQQADQQEAQAEAEARAAAVEAAAAGAAAEAAQQAEAERLAEEERKRKAEEERKRKEEEERIAKLRASFTLPLSSYNITSRFGDSGTMWQSNHTGTDFAAPTGTPVKNVHTGVVTEAGWAGSYGYRVTVELSDGTEVSYSHLSSITVSTGQEVITGETVGHVGSTGNSSGPHLHLEVAPGGGSFVDPLAWLRDKGLSV